MPHAVKMSCAAEEDCTPTVAPARADESMGALAAPLANSAGASCSTLPTTVNLIRIAIACSAYIQIGVA